MSCVSSNLNFIIILNFVKFLPSNKIALFKVDGGGVKSKKNILMPIGVDERLKK